MQTAAASDIHAYTALYTDAGLQLAVMRHDGGVLSLTLGQGAVSAHVSTPVPDARRFAALILAHCDAWDGVVALIEQATAA